jgi:hypothetical protein
MKRVMGLLLLWALAGCAATQTSDATPPDIRPTLVANRARLFKYPDSIRDAAIAPPHRHFLGWEACIRANGKNAFGGYAGLTTYTVLVYDNGSPPLLQEPTIYDGCMRADYRPFPEIEGGYNATTAPSRPPKR